MDNEYNLHCFKSGGDETLCNFTFADERQLCVHLVIHCVLCVFDVYHSLKRFKTIFLFFATNPENS